MHVEIVAIAVLVVIILIVITRVARANSIERSISENRRRLHSMEEVVHRSRERRPDVADRPTHRPLPDQKHTPPITPEARIDIAPEAAHPVSGEGRLVFGDLSLTPVKPPVPPIYETRRERRRSNHPAPSPAGGGPKVSKPLIASSAVIVLAAGGGAYALVSRHNDRASTSSTTTTTAAPRSSGGAPHKKSSGGTPHKKKSHRPAPGGGSTKPIAVLSSTATSATVLAPPGTYHVLVRADAPCWIGFERAKSPSGPWLADATIGSATAPATSVSISGPLVVAIGAPKSVTSITVNGVALPLSNLPPQAYDLYFTTTR